MRRNSFAREVGGGGSDVKGGRGRKREKVEVRGREGLRRGHGGSARATSDVIRLAAEGETRGFANATGS